MPEENKKKRSDVDILVELDSRLSLYDVIGIKLELEKKLKKKVDLVEYETIRPELKETILNEEVSIKTWIEIINYLLMILKKALRI